MFLTDLYDYYETNKNATNEIVLVHKGSGSNVTFRKYKEIFSGETKWLNLENGFLYKSTDVARYYDIKCNTIDFISKMDLLSECKVKTPEGNYTVQIRKIDDDAFMSVHDGHVKSGTSCYIWSKDDLEDYEVIA